MLYNFGYNKIDVSQNPNKPIIEEVERLEVILKMNTLQMMQYDEHDKKIMKICYENYSKNS